MSKRLINLYRVSTNKQVGQDNGDEISLTVQQTACLRYAKEHHPDWELVREVEEKGVSGFKKRAADRDAIQELQRAALQKEFDVLLVFMFDRIGRIDDETPHIVEWFVKQGIEVWSVNEGQQTFNNHVDKLLNYIRYWQASGESIKTSLRTSEALAQVVEAGHYKGGGYPFGYYLERGDRVNKKGYPLYDLFVQPEEAAVVNMIFDLYVNEGMGTKRIASVLTECGVKSRTGDSFTNPTIYHMLRNPTYMGILRSGKAQSRIIPALQIISPELFNRAQSLAEQKSKKGLNRKVPYRTQGKGLLTGSLFCGHCGARLVVTTSVDKRQNKNGKGREYVRIRYVCYNKTRHPEKCDGQTGYTLDKVDAVIDEIMRELFSNAKDSPETVNSQYDEKMDSLKTTLRESNRQLAEKQSQYELYKAELLKVLQGDSVFDKETLSELIQETKTAMEQAQAEALHNRTALEDEWTIRNDLTKQHENLISWADVYDESSYEAKKMIVASIIDDIHISRDYALDIKFNVDYESYLTFGAENVPDNGMRMEEGQNERTMQLA
ncbi:recombinase family protein [Oscillospiraceae bacterium OttesenSCG-928-G22]|nr:recombinase family protein [Oscillospiraceae bacterium OttesenSCG-928-G22]